MDNLEYEEAILTRRHEETLEALNAILLKLGMEKDVAIKQLGMEIKNAVDSLQATLQEPKEDKVKEDLSALFEGVVTALETLRVNPAKEWTFNIQRNSYGFIESVKATRD